MFSNSSQYAIYSSYFLCFLFPGHLCSWKQYPRLLLRHERKDSSALVVFSAPLFRPKTQYSICLIVALCRFQLFTATSTSLKWHPIPFLECTTFDPGPYGSGQKYCTTWGIGYYLGCFLEQLISLPYLLTLALVQSELELLVNTAASRHRPQGENTRPQ